MIRSLRGDTMSEETPTAEPVELEIFSDYV